MRLAATIALVVLIGSAEARTFWMQCTDNPVIRCGELGPVATPMPTRVPTAKPTLAPTPNPTPTPVAVATVAPVATPISARAIELLVGPLTPIGTTAYDKALLEQGAKFASAFPEKPDDLVSSNYYDLAFVLYTIYYRTNDVAWRDRARKVAVAWRDAPSNRDIPKYLAGDWSVGPWMPPGRSKATLGLAVLAYEAADSVARMRVNDQCRLVETNLTTWSDPREIGYDLMAMVASVALGDGAMIGQNGKPRAVNARTLLDTILAQQQAQGYWHLTSDLCPGPPFVLNYMDALLGEALVFYDRVIGDPRIVPALQKWAAWEWTTQWKGNGFQYANVLQQPNCGPDVAPDLSGMFPVTWGYLYSRTGDATYKDQGDAIFAGVVRSLGYWSGVKHFTQPYRSSGRYLGFVK